MRLQQREGEVVAAVADFVGVARKISRETRQQRHDKQIGVWLARARSQGKGYRRAVGNIHAAPCEPVAIDRIVGSEARVLQAGPRPRCLVNDAYLITVLQISA